MRYMGSSTPLTSHEGMKGKKQVRETSMYVCECMHACMYVCMYVCMCMHACMHVCMYVCMYMYVCMCVCMYVLCMSGCRYFLSFSYIFPLPHLSLSLYLSLFRFVPQSNMEVKAYIETYTNVVIPPIRGIEAFLNPQVGERVINLTI